MADSFYTNQINAERAELVNWVANTSEDVSNNLNSQHIDTNNLNGDEYIIQWGDTLSTISQATGITVDKLAYDNNISNIDLIYAGDVLILNRDGEVPDDWQYEGDGTDVAKTKVTINNYIDNSDNSVSINISPVNKTVVKKNTTNNNYQSPEDNGKDSRASSSSPKDADTKDKPKTSHEDADTDVEELDETEFSDAVTDEVTDRLKLDDDQLTVDFTAKDDDEDADSADIDDEDTEGNVDTEDEDTDTTTVYDDDQDVSTGSDKLTEKNAKKLAKKIVKQLKKDDKTEDIDAADDIILTITADDDDFAFNLTLASEEESSSDDSDTEDDVDTESDVDDESSDADADSSSSSDEGNNDDVDTENDDVEFDD